MLQGRMHQQVKRHDIDAIENDLARQLGENVALTEQELFGMFYVQK